MRFIYFILLLFPINVWACDCPAPNVESDARTMKRSTAIGTFDVLDIGQADWSKDGGANVDLTLGVQKLYSGALPNDSVVVKLDLADGCSRWFEVGQSVDLILYEWEGFLHPADMCLELTPSAWGELKD